MTRFALIAFALFTSACATDVQTNVEDTSDDIRASIEDLDMGDEEARSSSRSRKVVAAVLNEYGPLAKEYGCDIVGVVAASFRTRGAPIRGYIFDLKGSPLSLVEATMQWTNSLSGGFYGHTIRSKMHGTEYFIDGIFDRSAIEADFVPQDNDPSIPAYEFVADWSRRGDGGTLQGVIVDCI